MSSESVDEDDPEASAWASQQTVVAFTGMDEVELHPVLCAHALGVCQGGFFFTPVKILEGQ